MKDKLKYIVMILLGLFIGLNINNIKVWANPGSETDPVVTLSFVDQKVEQLKYYIDSKIENQNFQKETVETQELEIVKLLNGQKIIGESGTEIILRSGKAKAIGSINGGLCDITSGKDIGNAKDIEKNHLLLVPRSDQRGIQAQTDVYVMIRGNYHIIQ